MKHKSQVSFEHFQQIELHYWMTLSLISVPVAQLVKHWVSDTNSIQMYFLKRFHSLHFHEAALLYKNILQNKHKTDIEKNSK